MLSAAFAYCRMRACEIFRNVRVATTKSINRICNCLLFARYSRLSTFLNATPARFSQTRVCLDMHNTNAEREPLSPSSYRACLVKAWLSRARFLSSRRCFRAVSPEICRKVICARYSISHARYATTRTGDTE